jgi:hypothetical protein
MKTHRISFVSVGSTEDPRLPVELRDNEIPVGIVDTSDLHFVFQCPECCNQHRIEVTEIAQGIAPLCYNQADGHDCVEATMECVGFSLCSFVPISDYLRVLALRAEGDLKRAIEHAEKLDGQDQIDAIKVATDVVVEKGE